MGRYVVAPERAEIAVEATSTLHAIHGRATRATGALEIGPDHTIVGGWLEVEVRHLGWGNRLLDRETRRRVDERTHPSIRGTVLGDEPAADGRHRIHGTIAFLGATREVRGEVRVDHVTPDTVLVSGGQRFDVRDWGLTPPRLLALRVDPEITVRIRLEATRADR